MIQVYTFLPSDYFGSNCYVINADGEYAVVDPSVDYSVVSSKLGNISDLVKYILLTHCHFDHIAMIDSWVTACKGATVIVGKDDGPSLSDPVTNCYLGFLGVYDGYNGDYVGVTEVDKLTLGKMEIRVIECPGHTRGGVSYRIGDEIFVGDTVFDGGGYGRCDLPGGDFSALEKSIIKLITREADGRVYPGHGNFTTLERVIKNFM